MLGICEVNSPSPLDSNFNLGPWVPSMRQAVPTGSVYSTGHAITPEEWANRFGQRYYGPVVLVTDALCYSATDMFAAGFKDHRIGDILGTSGNTGAGGANVWTHGLLLVLAAGLAGTPMGNPFKPLPRGAGMRVSVRRTIRVGAQAGMPVEDLGVEPDHRHYMSRRDLMESNADLIDHAAKLLVGKLAHPLAAEITPVVAGSVDLKLTTKNIDWIAVQADGRPLKSFDVSDGSTRRKIGLPSGAATLEVIGYHSGRQVARNLQRLT
jgi:C-terminal processing protease CtpA/Prc